LGRRQKIQIIKESQVKCGLVDHYQWIGIEKLFYSHHEDNEDSKDINRQHFPSRLPGERKTLSKGDRCKIEAEMQSFYCVFSF
jgi:hypothetical protein